MIYDLKPTDGRKSFYGKAVVEITTTPESMTETLFSYNTPIISITTDNKTGERVVNRLWDGWTATTGRHIKAFCGMNKAEFMWL